ncbi:TetR family transcriptional regulator [Halocatena pleomorpha]|uniref:TetR family transcriptional regulator n=2 Tax=Halocatena pleomorpha TaxID=1785090 RepID=A0A3P3RDP4_9EURY|nr:TetR family transcriptional regulator [Halocatena pleomorpha]
MEATYRALEKHGYGNLTIQQIADEFENSKSLLYYHYESRDELLVEFLNYVLHEFITELDLGERPPREQLQYLVDTLLPETLEERTHRVQLAMFEMRSNAPHDLDCREQYIEVDTRLKSLVTGILQRGLETEAFIDIDPAVEAEMLVSLFLGTRARRLTVYDPDESIAELRTGIFSYIDRITAP